MENNKANSLTIVPLGGVGNVTKNMFLYIVGNEILIVDCGMGFPDAQTPGVDFLIPDITHLKKLLTEGKKIVGMCLTHGHEDHIGGIPFVIDQLPQFPIYATNLTAAFINEKLLDFGSKRSATPVEFSREFKIGQFTIKFLHVTHSVLDTSHIVIKTPAGNFYHGSDYKFDLTPADGNPSDLQGIAKMAEENITCLLSDCLGAERPGHSRSEQGITQSFEEEFAKAKGRVFISTYSSNISRMNQAIQVALKYNRKVCFVGRSFLKARDLGRKLGYLNLPPKMELRPNQVSPKDARVLILLPGSQAQEESALVRVASDNDQNLRINKDDTVIFSSDPIPGNEVNINNLIDTISKKGARVVHSEMTNEFHVSGHGFQNDIKLLMTLVKPKNVYPIGGNFRHMLAYRDLAYEMGFRDKQVVLPEVTQELIFANGSFRYGNKIPQSTVYVDQITGEEMEKFIIVDRQKIAKEGIVIVLSEVDGETGKLASTPDVIARGFALADKDAFLKKLEAELARSLLPSTGKTTHFGAYRKIIQRKAEELLYRERKEPLVVPVVVEI